MEHPSLIADRGTFKFNVGLDEAVELDTGMPVLGQVSTEHFLPRGQSVSAEAGVNWIEAGDWRVGGLSVDLTEDPEAAAQSLYQRLLAPKAGWHLARIWNHVPAINAPNADGLENYRAFSRGRALAFEQRFGASYADQVPAASAVGTASTALTVLVAMHRAPVRHVENPLQIPAYRYPENYGPSSPSFARATVAGAGADAVTLISGTAAIRGHVTVAPFDLSAQLICLEENLREISRAAGTGADLGRAQGAIRHFKVFVRNLAEFDGIHDFVTSRLLQAGDQVSYVQADVCRAELNVEIEVSIGSAASLGQLLR